ncbi:MAG: amidohydrolase [Desulfurococcales archaeon]|nr:amidohydrolase [Desulfurococcales archaeon]
MTDIYLRGGWVITLDKERRIIRDGAVAIDQGEIVAVGKREELDRDYRYYSSILIDTSRQIIMPGLVNTHVHMVQGLLRGCANYLPLIDWLTKRVWPLQGNYKPDEALASAKLVILEMIKSGTTTFLETGLVGRYGPDQIIEEAILKSGIRAAVARHVMDLTGYATQENALHPGLVEEGDTSFKDTIRLYHKFHGKGNRVWIWFGPRTPGAVSIELYRKISETARELKTGITMHLAEVREDVEYTMRDFGKRPVEFAHWVGLTGPNVVLVHVIWVTDEEIRLLAETGTTVSHNPCSNMKLASGMCRVSDMLRMGVNVALGTDGGPSNDTYDLLREMKHAALLQPVRALNAQAVRVEEVIEMATINGAKALGLDYMIGSIEVGKRADIITIDYWKPHLRPLNNPLSHLVYSASGHDVRSVIIDGKMVMLNRRVLTLDEERILEEADKAAYNLYNRAGICRDMETIWKIT